MDVKEYTEKNQNGKMKLKEQENLKYLRRKETKAKPHIENTNSHITKASWRAQSLINPTLESHTSNVGLKSQVPYLAIGS